jgi:hypothetical protein
MIEPALMTLHPRAARTADKLLLPVPGAPEMLIFMVAPIPCQPQAIDCAQHHPNEDVVASDPPSVQRDRQGNVLRFGDTPPIRNDPRNNAALPELMPGA